MNNLRGKDLVEGIQTNFTFQRRPHPLPAELRPDWRIAVLLICLKYCGRDGKMSLKKAHVLNWSALSKEGRSRLQRMLKGESKLEDVAVKFDPAFNRAIEFAAAEKLVNLNKKTTGLIIELSNEGEKLASALLKQNDTLIEEKEFFSAVKKVSENRIEELLNWETS